MSFQHYRKTTPTYARPLIEEDFIALDGVMETLEGPKSFQVGDYMARDAKGYWPIPRAKIEQEYRKLERHSPDPYTRWDHYEPLATREAVQCSESFTVNGLTGKAGDYLVRERDNSWPVDQEIFEASYTLVEEEKN